MEERGKEELLSEHASGLDGCATAPPVPAGRTEMAYLKRLTHNMNRFGDITSSLAWDDLTGMRLEAGNAVEA